MTAPDPLTPPDCDLRGYDYMPLFGHRLFRSHLYRLALRNPRAGLAAFKLWWEAWQQCPAGSLPDDDDDLAMLADFGLDTKGWLKIREIALHGFVKCSDGRIYHPIISSEAILAFERRKKERERKAANRKKKEDGQGSAGSNTPDVPPDVPRDNVRTGHVASPPMSAASPAEGDGRGQDRTGQGEDRDKERKEEAPSLRSPPQNRGSRLPTDWTPGDEGWHFARDLNLDPNAVLGKFRDHWAAKPGKDGVKLDWQATWRNWCRTDAERRKGKPGSGRSAADVFGVGQGNWADDTKMLGLPQ